MYVVDCLVKPNFGHRLLDLVLELSSGHQHHQLIFFSTMSEQLMLASIDAESTSKILQRETSKSTLPSSVSTIGFILFLTMLYRIK